MTDRSALSTIIAYARAGALDHAWGQFVAGGYDRRADDPATLSLKGRLLKDRAVRADGAVRRQHYRAAAEAYLGSAKLKPATYPLINAATLSLLAGDEPRAHELASEVLDSVDHHPGEPETPYYRAATAAEALLLLRKESEARKAFAEAIALAPQAWEDHASTLRQFALILSAQGADAGWLDAHRPPLSLHFAGHMSFRPQNVRRDALDLEINAALDEERIGFGYGALAAGADIIIAEALLQRGAELHVVLPCDAGTFVRRSVEPYGKEWVQRFDAALNRADTVRQIRPYDVPPDDATFDLADEVAMGAALMNGERLMSEAVQLLVLDAGGGGTGRTRQSWATGGWRQRLIAAPREEVIVLPPPVDDVASAFRVLAMLSIDVAADDTADTLRAADVEVRFAMVQAQLARHGAPALAPYSDGKKACVAYADVREGAEVANALITTLARLFPLRIGGHYGRAEILHDPFSGESRLAGDASLVARGAVSSAPAGSAFVTEDFAAAVTASGAMHPLVEYVGELATPDRGPGMGLFALKPPLVS